MLENLEIKNNQQWSKGKVNTQYYHNFFKHFDEISSDETIIMVYWLVPHLQQVGFLDAVDACLGVHHVEDLHLLEGDHASVRLCPRAVHDAELALADAALHDKRRRRAEMAIAVRHGVEQCQQLGLRHGGVLAWLG